MMLRRVLSGAAIVSALSSLVACSGTQLLNSTTSASDFREASNIVYDAKTGVALDVFTPTQAKLAPVVVFFYGGRWSEGDKSSYRFVGGALAKQGFVAVVPNYRQYPQVRYPSFLSDSAQAVRWTREHVQSFGGDPNKIFVMGHSAGAYNASMLALDEQWLASVGGSRQWLRGMIGLAGPYDFLPFTEADIKAIFAPPEHYAQTQPINHVDGHNPPLLLLHGRDDRSVFIKNSVNLANKVHAAGGDAEVIIYPKMNHVWIVATLSTLLQSQSSVMTDVAAFIHTHAVNQQPDVSHVDQSLEVSSRSQ